MNPNKPIIHLNNAGASLVSKEVLNAQIKYLRDEAQCGGYEAAALYHNDLESFYTETATLIGSSKDEIAFTESATVAWQRAFFSIPFTRGDIILTSKVEYASNYISYLYLQKEKGVEIKVIPGMSSGEINIDALEGSMSKNVRLISITHIPTNGGMVNPAEAIGHIAKKHNVLFLLDACQSVGQYPVDVKKIGCDFLSATGRKYLRGPRGTGFLYVNKKILSLLKPQNLDLHSANWQDKENYEVRSDARKFETWECNLAGKLGLTIAMRQLNEQGIENVWKRIIMLADYLRSSLATIENVIVRDMGKIKSGIVTFSTPLPSSELKNQLHKQGINLSVSFKSSTLLDMTERRIDDMIRASVHYYNSTEELDEFIEVLKNMLNNGK